MNKILLLILLLLSPNVWAVTDADATLTQVALESQTPTITETVTVTPSITETVTPTATPSVTPTATPTNTPAVGAPTNLSVPTPSALNIAQHTAFLDWDKNDSVYVWTLYFDGNTRDYIRTDEIWHPTANRNRYIMQVLPQNRYVTVSLSAMVPRKPRSPQSATVSFWSGYTTTPTPTVSPTPTVTPTSTQTPT